jgi:hypothetical protein
MRRGNIYTVREMLEIVTLRKKTSGEWNSFIVCSCPSREVCIIKFSQPINLGGCGLPSVLLEPIDSIYYGSRTSFRTRKFHQIDILL